MCKTTTSEPALVLEFIKPRNTILTSGGDRVEAVFARVVSQQTRYINFKATNGVHLQSIYYPENHMSPQGIGTFFVRGESHEGDNYVLALNADQARALSAAVKEFNVAKATPKPCACASAVPFPTERVC